MKFNIGIRMKPIYTFTLLLISIISVFADVKLPKANSYKEDKTASHSLFREKDSIERMSLYAQGVPSPKQE
jgi:hypothetical protein